MTTTTAPLVLIAGGSSAAGIATATALVQGRFRVLTVGSDAARIGAAAALTGGAVPLTCDLADADAVAALAAQVHADFGPVDGLIHLVGGWRGGKDLAAQSDDDWDFLHRSVLTTLRNTSRAFYGDIAASANGRIAIVSSTQVTAPTLGNANYATVKAAAETWVGALAQGLGTPDGATGPAAVVLVVKALVDPGMREKSPERTFPGFTDVSTLGHTVVRLFSTPASELNGSRLILS
ncbi:SDR family oxidoreductase [Arthrobacter sp. GMC3]|uniref:SDR family oxidoreductase n=1 Tax=Arthrobacter sp. GMC3 TaxID=2058894 RepID=UPI000CE30CF2|nr:SDR family oxidoreductase [Arthrobacter sp. GMC3]